MKGGATDVVSCFRAHSGTVFSLGSTYVVFEAEIARQGMLVLIWMGVVLVGGVAGAVRHTRTQAWGLIWEHALLPFFFFFALTDLEVPSKSYTAVGGVLFFHGGLGF